MVSKAHEARWGHGSVMHRWTKLDEWAWRLVALECILRSPRALARAAFILWAPLVAEARRSARHKR